MFFTSLLARVGVFVVVFVVAAGVLYLSGYCPAGFARPRTFARGAFPRRFAPTEPAHVIRSLGERVPWRLLIGAAALLLGIFVAVGEASNWDAYLKAIYGTKFGITEPAFGQDVGFYVFTLPLLTDLRDLALLLIFLGTAIAAGIYWARGVLDFREAPPRISAAAVSQFSVLLGLFFLQRAILTGSTGSTCCFIPMAWSTVSVTWTTSCGGRVSGCYRLTLAAAIMCFSNLIARGARRLVLAAVIVFAGLILNLLQPVIESLRVKPDELWGRKPVIRQQYPLTRHA